jgi:hypothetical protein
VEANTHTEQKYPPFIYLPHKAPYFFKKIYLRGIEITKKKETHLLGQNTRHGS